MSTSWPLYVNIDMHTSFIQAATRIQRAFRWHISHRYKNVVDNWKEDDIFSQAPVHLIPRSLLIILPCYGNKIKRGVSALDMIAWAYASEDDCCCCNPYDTSEELTAKQMKKIRTKAANFITREIDLWKMYLSSMSVISPGDPSSDGIIVHLTKIMRQIGDVAKDFHLNSSGYKNAADKKQHHIRFVNAYSKADAAVEELNEKLISEKSVIVDTFFQQFSVEKWINCIREAAAANHVVPAMIAVLSRAVSSIEAYETDAVHQATQVHWPADLDTDCIESSNSSSSDEEEEEQGEEEAHQMQLDL